MKLPRKISPCPIVDAVSEIRFETNIDNSAVFGIIYNVLRKDFQNVEKLDILQLPEHIRDNDEKLKFKPHYALVDKDKFYRVSIGPRVLSVSYINLEILMNKEPVDSQNTTIRLELNDEDFTNLMLSTSKFQNKENAYSTTEYEPYDNSITSLEHYQKILNDKPEDEKKLAILGNVAEYLVENSVDLDNEYAKIVNDNFWDLL